MKRLRASAASPAIAGVFICAALLLGGCASPQVSRLSGGWPAELPAQAELTSAPFFAQAEYECGPAALAMAITAAGTPITPEALVPQVYLPARKGSLQVEMPVAVRRAGLLAYMLAPELQAVLTEVAAGNPVVVFQNLSLPWYPVWHYAVVIGYDRDAQTLLMHSGTTARMPISLSAFERTWARGNYWALVALPPGRLPATADAARMAAAVVALERVNPKAALATYGSALERWPADRSFLLGRGNTAYALGDLPAAQSAYAAATVAQPDFADAWNNLAQVLLEQRLWAPAQAAIAKAIALGGPRLPAYLDLQKAITATQPP
jgi:hypothetical protein